MLKPARVGEIVDELLGTRKLSRTCPELADNTTQHDGSSGPLATSFTNEDQPFCGPNSQEVSGDRRRLARGKLDQSTTATGLDALEQLFSL
jgi:hypothetical protein